MNTQTGKILKRTINGGYTIDYWINKKFIPLKKLNEYCELIPKVKCPF